MAEKARNRLLAHGWLYIPAVSGPIGGGLIKLGGGNVWAAVLIAAIPYALCGAMYLVFIVGYVVAVARFAWSGKEGQEAMESLIEVSANAIVAILTLTRTQGGLQSSHQSRRTPTATQTATARSTRKTSTT